MLKFMLCSTDVDLNVMLKGLEIPKANMEKEVIENVREIEKLHQN
jgi:hypothetical protein